MSSEIARQAPMSLGEQVEYANVVSRASIVPDAYRGRPADIVVAIGFGQSIGLSPAESLYRINVIKGKPTMSAELIAAQVRKAGHKLRIAKDEARKSVTATIIRCDDPDAPFSVTRDEGWARDMGLLGNPNYRKQPMTMLTWRAITACAREACPEALFGVAYTPDEMHDMDEPRQAARPVEVEATVSEPEAPQAPQVPERLVPLMDRVGALKALTGVGAKAICDSILQRHAAQRLGELDDRELEQECRDLDAEIAREQERQGEAA